MSTQSRTHQAKVKLKRLAAVRLARAQQQLTSSAFSSRLWVRTRSASVAVDVGGTSGIIIAHP